MSLINRVLKDLEKRNAPEVSDADALPAQVKAAPGSGRPRLPAYGWVVLALILALIAAGWWWAATPDPAVAPERPSPTVQAPITTMAPSADDDEQPLPAPEAAPAAPGNAEDPAFTEEEGWAAPPSSETEPSVVPEPMPQTEEPAPSTLEPPQAQERVDQQAPPLDASERAQQEFRRGMGLFQMGRIDEAQTAWYAALAIDPGAVAPRQALLGILLERGERQRAERLLEEGLRADPRQPKQAMLLARLQLDRGAQAEALRTLEQGLPHAQWNAQYLSMTAAVMARVGRHRDAADLYASALRIAPNNPVWEMGRGMALRAEGERAEALAAFQRARRMPGLSPDLQAFVERQIRELQ